MSIKNAASVAAEIQRLIDNTPAYSEHGAMPVDLEQWSASAMHNIEACDPDVMMSAGTVMAGRHIAQNGRRRSGVEEMRGYLHRCLLKAQAEAATQAPTSALVPAGGHWSAFMEVRKRLAVARTRVLIVDPYMDAATLPDYLHQIPAGVRVDVLLRERPLGVAGVMLRWQGRGEARRAQPKRLHDRWIIIDDDPKQVWSVSQSFNRLAATSPLSILSAPAEHGNLTIQVYEDIWNQSDVLAP